jgi:hypothetical protein
MDPALVPALYDALTVARLGSVKAAATALGVSEPAVSQALAALRQHLGDQLITRGASGMTLTAGGARLPDGGLADGRPGGRPGRGVGGEAHRSRCAWSRPADRGVRRDPADRRVHPRTAKTVETTCGVAGVAEMPVLIGNGWPMTSALAEPGRHRQRGSAQ